MGFQPHLILDERIQGRSRSSRTVKHRTKSMILCESVKQIPQIFDLVVVAYSVSTHLTLGRGVSYKDGSIRAGSHRINRKKSPYPKTHNPKYTKIVQQWMQNILDDKSSPILI